MGSFIGNILTARALLRVGDSQVIANRDDKFLDGDFGGVKGCTSTVRP